MPVFTFTKTYHDGSPLFAIDLDNLRNSVELAVNSTKLDVANVQDTSLTPAVFEDSGIFISPGIMLDYTAASAPTGWLLCDGSAVSRTTYSALFAAIGDKFGVGDGSTTFNIPNAQKRATAGRDNMGQGAANRLTLAGSNLDGTSLGASGGDVTIGSHTHGAGTLAGAAGGLHTHTFIDPGHTHIATVFDADFAGALAGYNQGSNDNSAAPITQQPLLSTSSDTTGVTIASNDGTHTHPLTGSTANQGSGTTNQNVQPTIIFNKIIKF